MSPPCERTDRMTLVATFACATSRRRRASGTVCTTIAKRGTPIETRDGRIAPPGSCPSTRRKGTVGGSPSQLTSPTKTSAPLCLTPTRRTHSNTTRLSTWPCLACKQHQTVWLAQHQNDILESVRAVSHQGSAERGTSEHWPHDEGAQMLVFEDRCPRRRQEVGARLCRHSREARFGRGLCGTRADRRVGAPRSVTGGVRRSLPCYASR